MLLFRRSFFAVLAVLFFAGALAYAFFSRSSFFSPSEQVSTEDRLSPEVLLQEWESGVRNAIRLYGRQEERPAQIRDRLLALRVPSDKREQHLELVLALEAIIQEQTNAEIRWQKAIKPFSGL